MSGYRFPKACKTIIDVTQAPYYCDNTGKEDCTKQLCQVIDDIFREYEKNFYETEKKLREMEDPNALITFEIRKIDGISNVVFPEKMPDSKIIYFPNGTYLISDTVSYSIEEFRFFLRGIRSYEMNNRLRFMGESRDGVVIKLQDDCKGFEYGNDRPMISFAQGGASNVAMTNMLENMTLDAGKGNPGATGIRFFANNTGAIRNVRIVSSDPEGRGNTGISVLHDDISAGYMKNVEVDGFSYGMKFNCHRYCAVMEHIKLKGQNRAGIYLGDLSLTIRDLQSDNFVPAIRVEGLTAKLILTDSRLTGGNPLDGAVYAHYGQCMLRNVQVEGYARAAFTCAGALTGNIAEFCTYGPKTLFEDTVKKSLQLPVEETPEVAWEAPEAWICVNDFGAKGDGVTDDTEAIQSAFRSGGATIYFQPGNYLINDVISIPATVTRVNFMYCDLVSGEKLARMKHTGAFLVKEETETPLILEDLYAMEKFYGYVTFVEHACRRPLILSDLHVQTASMYFNTVPGGKVYLENVACTIGGVPGAGLRTKALVGEENYPYDRETPCFHFIGQEVWCRQLNPERSLYEVVNDGGKLWVIGGKTEEEGTTFVTKNHGYTEVYGMAFCIGLDKEHPIIINDNSNVSVCASTYGMGGRQSWPVAVREIRGEEERCFYKEDMPVTYMNQYVIPLYIGRNDETAEV